MNNINSFTSETVATFLAFLASWDRYSDRSDDIRVWRRGNEEWKQIQKVNALDLKFQKVFDLWIQHDDRKLSKESFDQLVAKLFEPLVVVTGLPVHKGIAENYGFVARSDGGIRLVSTEGLRTSRVKDWLMSDGRRLVRTVNDSIYVLGTPARGEWPERLLEERPEEFRALRKAGFV